MLITRGILRSTMGTLHALASLPLQFSTIVQRHRINLRSRRQAVTRNGLVRNGFLVGNGLLGIRGHGGWARNKVCGIRGNFGGNGGLGISLDRKALCVFIPNGVGIR